MYFLYVFYFENVLYMFRADKLFIFKRHFMLYMQMSVLITLKDIKNSLKLRCRKLK